MAKVTQILARSSGLFVAVADARLWEQYRIPPHGQIGWRQVDPEGMAIGTKVVSIALRGDRILAATTGAVLEQVSKDGRGTGAYRWEPVNLEGIG